ncbi:MAG: hypothetical protein E5Y32_31470 [Mesorhizobium sp.]|nr:MAG: hypothetical protein E5Y32_31470 [Mesorhizobium sp.]
MARLSFSLCIRSLVPAVPRECLCPTHAPSTPVAARPIRHPADLSQDDETVLVSHCLTKLVTDRLRCLT